jgi:(E)-4-hydroxy-3-methylbut-2-enyl-diphosphate synthase
MVIRRKTRSIKIGSLSIGSNNPVAIQSMTKTRTEDVGATLRQIKRLERAGCEIVRIAVKNKADAQAIDKIKAKIKIPLVADIHFDWRLAIEAIERGADKIRLNPGNICKKDEIEKIIQAAKSADISVRVGLNSGSLEKLCPQGIKESSLADTMVKAAMDYIRFIESLGFFNLVVSLKGTDIFDTFTAYRKMSNLCDYPFHLGVTASGLPLDGTVKSSIAVGGLLSEGIGDTIRISLTANPELEIRVAKLILGSLGLHNLGCQIISCPSCGRCEVDLLKIVRELERKLPSFNFKNSTRALKVAVMGCVVNGPGEAKQSDIGVAFGRKDGLLFKKGRPIKKVSYSRCVGVLLQEIARLVSG